MIGRKRSVAPSSVDPERQPRPPDVHPDRRGVAVPRPLEEAVEPLKENPLCSVVGLEHQGAQGRAQGERHES